MTLFHHGVLLVPFVHAFQPEADAATVKSVQYKATSSGGEVTISSDGKVEYEVESNEGDRQVVLNLKQAELSPEALKKIDASTEEGPVLEIAPYKVEGENQQARVVIQLKGDSKPDVTQKGNTIKIAIPNPSSAESVAESAPSEPMPVPSWESARISASILLTSLSL
ncbi:AMIN domain-containing protein [bacterium]|nr:AMIN domain-containing protein [bacterium]